ncbi:MAG: enoyl-CoA hydratase/isomerase family protein [Bryobacteraceae bacterium]
MDNHSSGLERRMEGRVLRLTLNRPEKRNALGLPTCRALVDAIEDAMHEDSTGAILLDAEGSAFCSGMDLGEMFTPGAHQLAHVHEQLFTLVARTTKPIVAAVQGAALAAGMGLVANAHIVVAAEDAQFGLTEIRIGLWPYIVFRSIAMAIGERRAVELSLSGRILDAAEAKQIGLVSDVCPTSELKARAETLAKNLSESSLEAVRSGLLFVSESRGKSLVDAGHTAFRFREESFRSRDFIEGVKAFREKRSPRWPSMES